MNRPVFLTTCPDYQPTHVEAAVEEAFSTLKLEELLFPGANVVIKPNLVMKSKPDSAIITHPNLVEAVATAIQKRGGVVTIAESSGGLYNPTVLKNVYAVCGYEDMAQRCGVALNLDCSYDTLPSPHGKRVRQFSVLTPILQADLVVNIAKLKSHCMTGMSAAVKNLFGVVPGLMKPEFHCRFPDKADFGEMLADLCQALAPAISFVDGIWAMEGNGPSGGNPRFVGALAAGRNPFSLDMICAKLMAMEPADIFMLRAGMERGLCPKTVEEIPLFGEPLSTLVVPDFLAPESRSNDFVTRLPRFLRPLASKLLTPIPKIRERSCIGCGKCAESCPQHVIIIEQHKAHITYRDCIRCYCCHEMCPAKSVDIQRFPLFPE